MLELKDLRDRFNTHTEWHCYRHKRTRKTFALDKPLKTTPEHLDKLGTASGCSHRQAVRHAKGIQ